MSQTLFPAACTTLWGPQYRSEMARQLDVYLRTVMRWDKGETAVPPIAMELLAQRLVRRRAEIGKLLARIVAGRGDE